MSSAALSPVFSWRSLVVSSDLPASTRHVALTLSLHMSERGDSCYPSLATLEQETGLSRTCVCKALKLLQDRGLLKREKGTKGKSTRYTAWWGSALRDSALSALGSASGVPEVVKGQEQEQDQHLSAAPRPSKPNPVWDALVAVTGFTPTTTSEKSDFGKTVRELRAVIPETATDDEILRAMRARKAAWERNYDDARFTHRVLRGKWAELGALAVGSGARPTTAFPELADGETF